MILPGVPFLQELVEGKSLAKMVEAGWKPAQKEVERIADELLSTLAYLQDQKVSMHLAYLQDQKVSMHAWFCLDLITSNVCIVDRAHAIMSNLLHVGDGNIVVMHVCWIAGHSSSLSCDRLSAHICQTRLLLIS